MRRADLTTLTGLTTDFFNSLARREQFPFLAQPTKGGKGWGDYRPQVAYKTLLALALADAGATQEAAGRFVDVEFELLANYAQSPGEVAEKNIYFGYAKVAESEYDPEIKRYTQVAMKRPLCGSFDAISNEIEQLERKGGLHSVVVVNASEHLRTLKRRVEEWRLDPKIAETVFDGDEVPT